MINKKHAISIFGNKPFLFIRHVRYVTQGREKRRNMSNESAWIGPCKQCARRSDTYGFDGIGCFSSFCRGWLCDSCRSMQAKQFNDALPTSVWPCFTCGVWYCKECITNRPYHLSPHKKVPRYDPKQFLCIRCIIAYHTSVSK